GTYMGLPMHLLTGLTAVTFDFWAQFGANGNDAHVFDFGNTNFIYLGTGGYPENYVYYSPHTGSGNNTLGASAGSFEFEQGVTGTGTFDNQTMHITCVIDPPDQFMGIYTNGVLEASITNFGVSLASIDDQQCWIGRALFSNLRNYAYLNASINELRIYSGALSPGSVVQSDFAGPNGFLPSGPVQLVSQPSSQAVLVGETVTFSGLAGGEPPISYQWYENGTAIPNATNTTYSFVAASGQNGDTFALAAANNVGGTNYTATSTNAILTVVSNPQTLTWLGANGNAWDTSTLNWSNANTASIVAFGPFDGALFDNHGSAQPNVNLVQPLNPLVVTVDSTANYTLSSTAGNGSLVGNGELVKNNTGTLVIDVTNLMTGPVTISGGTVQIGNNDTLGAIGSPVTNNASLVLARSDATSLPGPISGTGSVTVNAGTVSAAGTNSYTGASTINGGIVTMATSAALGATNGAITVANGGELYITGNFDEGLKPLVLAGSGVANGGALRKGGAGVTGYYGPVTLTADATLNVDGGATLNLTNSAPLDGAGANANLTLAGSGAGNIVGSISLGTGNLTVSGGTWTVAASNNYSGLTTISGGSLLIPSRQSLGPVPGAFNSAEISLVGGTLGVTTNVALNDGNAGITVGNGTVLNGGLSVAAGSTLILSNDISGSGSAVLTKSGPGTLILQAANDFSGTLNIDGNSTSANDGSTVIANNAAIANLLALQGFPAIYIRNNNSGSSTLALDGTAGALNIAPDISMAGRNVAVPEIENLIGDNTISGSFELQVGGSYYLQSDSGTLTLSAPLPYSSPGGSRQIIFTGAGTILPAGAIQDGTTPGGTNGFVAILKTGTGRLLLTTANTYSGATGISNGVVVLSGSIASTNAVLVNGGLLVSAGSIAGPVNVGAAGSVEAGTTNTIGVFTLGGGALTLHGNTIVKINKGASANDSFTGQGVVTYGGTLTVTNLSGTLTTNDTFTLFSPGTSTSNFSSIVGSPGTGLAYSFTNGVLRIVNGIATNPTNILFSVSGNTLTLSWPADHQGWILQAQTNSLSSGLGTNWVDVPNSASITSTNIVIVPQNASVFYRLRSPN
ncbi:MAG TPA: autotransporter-associated beta strand repeat-containing protein, partial [Verrucomicrobiae bacterium]|nr:autotransporter-associated beta strand repeat-containing protein [Verrucomicrobiae bacterium]